MKNLLILIVAIALFLHFYPQPELQDWFEEQKAMVLAEFSEATDTKVRLSPGKIYKDLEQKFAQFNEEERIFVKALTESRASVKDFYQQYCGSKAISSPKLHHNNQKVVCDAITPYQALF